MVCLKLDIWANLEHPWQQFSNLTEMKIKLVIGEVFIVSILIA